MRRIPKWFIPSADYCNEHKEGSWAISARDLKLLLRVARAAEKLIPASFFSPYHSTEILKAVDALNKPRKP